jgi:hypothetical protein
MIDCSEHGFASIVLVSADLLGAEIENSEIIGYKYEYDGDIVESFYVSKDFAENNGLSGVRTLQLPEVYPHWFSKLKPYCVQCLIKNRGQNEPPPVSP